MRPVVAMCGVDATSLERVHRARRRRRRFGDTSRRAERDRGERGRAKREMSDTRGWVDVSHRAGASKRGGDDEGKTKTRALARWSRDDDGSRDERRAVVAVDARGD